MFPHTRAIIAFFMRTYWLPLVAVVLITTAFCIDQASSPHAFKPFTSLWNDSLNAYAGVATLVVALAVLYGEVRQDWRNTLPNKLTVVFEYDHRTVMICRLADLGNAGDARALAQQIGKQMASVELAFKAPTIRQSGGSVERTGRSSWYRHYHLHIVLRSMPADLPESVKNGEAYRVWQPPFEEFQEEALRASPEVSEPAGIT